MGIDPVQVFHIREANRFVGNVGEEKISYLV